MRELFERESFILSAGIWDAFSAKVVEQEGFKLLALLGSLASRSLIGKADLGYITQTEMADIARRVTLNTEAPLIVDCDDGFGDSMIVRRTVQLFEQCGAAGVIIEDLKRPLFCSALGGGSLLPAEEMVNKIKAAVDVREDQNFFIIARTDNYEGVDEVINRANTYGKAGADLVFSVGLTSAEDHARVAKESDIPLAAIQSQNAMYPLLPPATLEEMGYKVAIYTRPLFGAAALGLQRAARTLFNSLKNRSALPVMEEEMAALEAEEIVGRKEDVEIYKRYSKNIQTSININKR